MIQNASVSIGQSIANNPSTDSHSKPMITSPAPNRCNPKNTGVHNVLSAICSAQKAMTYAEPSIGATRAAANAIEI